MEISLSPCYRYVDELKRMGARIQVDDKTAVVEGVEKLTGGSYAIIPDQIEAGTYMAAGTLSVTREVPSARQRTVVIWGCISVGKPG